MIDLVSEGPGISRNQNVNDQRGKGFEIVGRYDITTNAKLEANYAYQDSENDLTGQKIADAPGQQLFLGIDYTFSDNWSFTSQLYWIGDRKRPTNDNRPEMDDYTNVNATLLYKSVESNWSARLAIRNLLDSDQREPSTGAMPDDYPLEGRRVGIEVEYSF
jgi:iron complex outermembrane receptor protein